MGVQLSALGPESCGVASQLVSRLLVSRLLAPLVYLGPLCVNYCGNSGAG